MSGSVRKLVALDPVTVAAVERFRDAPELREPCPTCGHHQMPRSGRPSESAALRRLIEIGLERWERRDDA